ncbi:hypothetical protein EX895_004407 [Sporisorium graminicola]|uniref:Uncharacterized protein n=1 Tax=Sporisorium graminicola TaxID=280036 RepID=A0A4U7KS14_9BASI|nr:hypothetical protein EX895_004407 [Sporisorium graminicola]TKY86767.1 hypothetical protein EX895_004407 [Sporisorium graminicola]
MKNGNPETVTLVIDTSRQRTSNADTGKSPPCSLRTPDTSSTETTILWSARASESASARTPSTALSSKSNCGRALLAHRPNSDLTSVTTTGNPEWLISKIDEYLADLSATLPVPHLSKACRRSLKLDLDPLKLLSVERALPSSPDAVRRSHLCIPPLLLSSGSSSGKSCSTSMPSSPLDFNDDLFSPLFYRCFSKPDSSLVCEDAAPFPYSPCQEAVCLDRGVLESTGWERFSGSGREQWRRPSVIDICMEAAMAVSSDADGNEVGSEAIGGSTAFLPMPMPSIRLEAAKEGGAGEVVEDDKVGHTLQSAASSVCSSSKQELVYWCREEKEASQGSVGNSPVALHLPASTLDVSFPASLNAQLSTPARPAAPSLHVPAHTLLPPTIPPRRGLSRSASAGNLTRVSTPHTPHTTSSESLHHFCSATRSNTEPNKPAATATTVAAERTPPRASSRRAVEVSPTSTQIVTGVRKINKLKQLLGEEVGSHIGVTPAALCTPARASLEEDLMAPLHTRITRDTKPLPCLPASRSLQRSQTTASTSTCASTCAPATRHANRAVLGSHRPRDKKCCATGGDGNTGRPSTTRERCNCTSCEASDATKQALKLALTGTSLRLPPPPPRPVRAGLMQRPSTSGSMKARKIAREASFLDVE